MKQQKTFVATFLVAAFAVVLVINSTPVAARVLRWSVTDCSQQQVSGCANGVRKIATVSVPNINGYPIQIDATLTSGVKVVVLQTNQTYGDLRATFVFNNVGTFPPTFERKQRDGKWQREAGRPSDYQETWVKEQIVGLQKQDKDFDFTDAR